MKKWIAFYTNDGASGSDESDWAIYDTREDALPLLDSWRESLPTGYRIEVALMECPAAWVRLQLTGDYFGCTDEDEYFWPIPSRGA
jgi:hypothetical protein